LVQREDWEFLRKRLPKQAGFFLRLRQLPVDRSVSAEGGTARTLAPRISPAPATPSPQDARILLAANEGLAVLFAVWMGVCLLSNNRVVPRALRPASFNPIANYARFLGIAQTWRHYAKSFGSRTLLVVDATTVAGEHVDPLGERSHGHG